MSAAGRLPTARVQACATTIGVVALGLAVRLVRDPSRGAAAAMVLGSGWLGPGLAVRLDAADAARERIPIPPR